MLTLMMIMRHDDVDAGVISLSIDDNHEHDDKQSE